MTIQIQTAEAALGKKLETEADKKDDNRLKGTVAVQFYITREQFDEVAGQKRGWCSHFYDEMGAPVGNIEIKWIKRELDFYGRFSRGEGKHAAVWELKKATLIKLRVRLEAHGATLIGTLVFPAAGDEADTAHMLLGQQVDLAGVLAVPADGQSDFVKDQHGAEADDAAKPKANGKGTDENVTPIKKGKE